MIVLLIEVTPPPSKKKINKIKTANCQYLTKIAWGWPGGAKVLCILGHWGVQLILPKIVKFKILNQKKKKKKST